MFGVPDVIARPPAPGSAQPRPPSCLELPGSEALAPGHRRGFGTGERGSGGLWARQPDPVVDCVETWDGDDARMVAISSVSRVNAASVKLDGVSVHGNMVDLRGTVINVDIFV